MNERIKKLRKKLELTQQEFAERLGTGRNNIAGYETGKRSPSEAVITLICREFNVSKDWLQTGEGEMFNQEEDDPVGRLCREVQASQLETAIMRAYFQIDKRVREPFIRQLIEKIQTEAITVMPEKAQEPKPVREMTREELHAELDRQLEEEKRPAGNPSVCG